MTALPQEPTSQEYVLWEFIDGELQSKQLEVSDRGHLQIYLQERIIEFTEDAPGLEELEYLGKKPVIVCSKTNSYWMLCYEKTQAAYFEQHNDI